jgi:hypothetical protein
MPASANTFGCNTVDLMSHGSKLQSGEILGAYPFKLMKGKNSYMELIVGHRDRTALLKAVCCMKSSGSLLFLFALRVAAVRAVTTTIPAPNKTGLLINVIAAVQETDLCWCCRLLVGGLDNFV